MECHVFIWTVLMYALLAYNAMGMNPSPRSLHDAGIYIKHTTSKHDNTAPYLFHPYQPSAQLSKPRSCRSSSGTDRALFQRFPEPYRSTSNKYIPTGCVTYCERYSFVFDKRLVYTPNRIPATQAIVVKVAGRVSYSSDFHWFIRSLVYETPRFHVYLLLLDYPGQNLPTEFHNLTVHISEDHMRHEFPTNFENGWFHCDYSVMLFWDMVGQHKGYNFVWSLEEDIRYIGSNWGAFLSSSYVYATEQSNPRGQDPDYITFSPICRPRSDWAFFNTTRNWQVADEDKRQAYIMASGFSARTLQAGVQAVKHNTSVSYCELFFPTLTHLLGFKQSWVSHPIYGSLRYGEGARQRCLPGGFSYIGMGSYHDRPNGYADKAYYDWRQGGGCHGFALMHKVTEHA